MQVHRPDEGDETMDAQGFKDEAVEGMKNAAESFKDGAGNFFNAAKQKAEEISGKDLDGNGKIGN